MSTEEYFIEEGCTTDDDCGFCSKCVEDEEWAGDRASHGTTTKYWCEFDSGIDQRCDEQSGSWYHDDDGDYVCGEDVNYDPENCEVCEVATYGYGVRSDCKLDREMCLDGHGQCCGNEITDPGWVYASGNSAHACFVEPDEDGEPVFQWMSTGSDYSVHNVTSRQSYWHGGDMFGENPGSDNDFHYVLGVTDQASAVACGSKTVAENDFYNTDCTEPFVECLVKYANHDDYQNVFNPQGYNGHLTGYACIGGDYMTYDSDEIVKDSHDRSDVDDTRIAVCDTSASDFEYESSSVRVPLGGHVVAEDGESPIYCTDFGFLSDLDEIQNDAQRIEATDSVTHLGIYTDHYYEPLDRLWATSEFVCGNKRLNLADPTDYEFFNDSTYWANDSLGSGEIRRACWNNLGILNGDPITRVPSGRYTSLDTIPYNMLRLNNNPFADTNHLDNEVGPGFLYNWDFWGYNSTDVFEGQEDFIQEYIFDDDEVLLRKGEAQDLEDYDGLILQSKYPFRMVEDVPYVLVLSADMKGGQRDFKEVVNFTLLESPYFDHADGGQTIELIEGLPANLEREIDDNLLSSSGNPVYHAVLDEHENGSFALRMDITNNRNSKSSVIINRLSLTPRPVALNKDGEFLACEAKEDNTNPLSDIIDTNTDTALFNNDELIEHCTEQKEDHVCTPDGTWIPATDENSPDDRSPDEREFSHVSTSPNIIEDSDFEYGGPDEFISLDRCEVETDLSVGGRSVQDQEEADRDVIIGKDYLSCESAGDKITFKDSDDTDLDNEDGYIFSAWVRSDSSGSIEFLEYNARVDEVEFEDSAWHRVEVSGKAIGGEVTIRVRGDMSLDSVQLEPKHDSQIERGNYFPTVTRRSCCPDNACWNGEECVYLDDDPSDSEYRNKGHEILDDPGFETNMGERGYICISGGDYEFGEKSYRWVHETGYDFGDETIVDLQDSGDLFTSLSSNPALEDSVHVPEHGFCPPNDCFVGRNQSTMDPASSDSLSFRNIDRQDCIEDATSYDDLSRKNEFNGRYCMQGEWHRKTPHVSSFLLDLPEEEDTVSLYCGNYRDVLNYYEYTFDSDLDSEYHNILGQDLVPLLSHDGVLSIKYADKACVLKYGDGPSNQVVALPLNTNASGTGDDVGSNDIDDYMSDGEVDIASAFTYFNVKGNNDCLEHIGSDDDRFVQCAGGTFYNPRHDVILHTHSSRTDDRDKIREESLDVGVDGLSYQEEIDDIKDYLSSEFEDDNLKSSYRDEYWALKNHSNFDDIFLFKSDQHNLFISREKLIDVRDEEMNKMKYMFMLSMEGFSPDEEFDSEYGEIVSPLNRTRQLNTSDIFNISPKSIAFEDGDTVYGLSSVGYSDSEFYRHWYTFSGRLRGDLELPPRD